MKITIEGTKSEMMELLAEIRRRDKEYTIIPNYITTPQPTKYPWHYEYPYTTAKCGDTE